MASSTLSLNYKGDCLHWVATCNIAESVLKNIVATGNVALKLFVFQNKLSIVERYWKVLFSPLQQLCKNLQL